MTRPRQPQPGARVAVAALAVAVAALTVAVLGVARSEQILSFEQVDEGRAVPQREQIGPLGEPGPEAPADGEAAFDAAVAQITAFVERTRGLTFKRQPTVQVVGADGLAKLAREHVAEQEADLIKDNDLLHALGILPPDVDLIEQASKSKQLSIGGLYDPEAGELKLRDRSLTPYARSTIAHELTHALEDQHFDLHREVLQEDRDGAAFGFRAVGEGSARRIEYAYLDSLSEAERRAADTERERLGARAAAVDVHPYVGMSSSAAYQFGEPLVEAIVNDGGQEALDEAFRSPPTTHEQVLFPQRFLNRDEAIEVSKPVADGTPSDEGVIGVFKLGIMLGGAPGQGAAARWGGDRYVVWQGDDGRKACLRANVVGDSPQATDELAAALRDRADKMSRASVKRAGGRVVFTSCVVKGEAWSAAGYGDDTELDCPGTPLIGFGEAQVTITGAGAGEVQRCVLLADTPQRVTRGLMEVTDAGLGGYDGMLFVYPEDTKSGFWMRNTPMPLSIAYLDSDGRIVSTADMAPCADSPECRSYPPEGPYRFAVEVPQGGLGAFGLVEGATLRIDGVTGAG